MVEYIGFDKEDDGKFIVKLSKLNGWSYVNYQLDEQTQVIVGYIIPQSDGSYLAQCGCCDETPKKFINVQDGVNHAIDSYCKKNGIVNYLVEIK